MIGAAPHDPAESEEFATRPGVRVWRGTELIFPPGSITISIGEAGLPTVELAAPVARYQAWPDWIEIAIKHATAAQNARRSMSEAIASGDGREEHDALVGEFHGTLVAVTGSAFAVDAFYAACARYAPVSDDERAARTANRLPRHAWVFDTIRRCTKLTNVEASELKTRISTLYRLRDLGVHPDYAISDFVIHPGLRQAAPAILAHFRSENALAGVALAAEVIMRVADFPLPNVDGEFAAAASDIIHALIDDHVSFSPESPLRPKPAPTSAPSAATATE